MFEKIYKPESVKGVTQKRDDRVKHGKQRAVIKDNRQEYKRILNLNNNIGHRGAEKQFISGISTTDTSLRVMFRDYHTHLNPGEKQAIVNYLSSVYDENITVVKSKPDITIHSGVSNIDDVSYNDFNNRDHIGYNSLIYGSVNAFDISDILNTESDSVKILKAGNGRGVDIVIMQ